MTITPLHQLTFIFDTFHTSLMTVTLSVKWCTSSSPLLLPMTITPPHQWTNLLSHFLTTVTPSSLITITPLCQLTHLSYTFHTSLRTVTLPVIYHTFLVAILHLLLCSATVTLHGQLSPFPNGTYTFFTALILHVHFSHFPDNLTGL